MNGLPNADSGRLARTHVPASQVSTYVRPYGDKGYQSAQTLVNLEQVDLRGYVSEPDRGWQKWTAKTAAEQAFKRQTRQAVYRNRRRRRGRRSKALQRKRAELVERSFEHMLDDGGMRRVYLRGRANIVKR